MVNKKLTIFTVTALLVGTLVTSYDYQHQSRDRTSNERSSRCGTTIPTDLAEFSRSREYFRSSKRMQRTNINFINETKSVNINVYFHIIKSASGEGDISDAVLDRQIGVLNRAFSGNDIPSCGDGNGGSADTPFRYFKAGVDRTVNDVWWNNDMYSDKAMKYALHKGNCSDLNIYLSNPGGSKSLLGWATFPQDCASKMKEDGVVLNYKTLPGGNINNYNEGDTLTHEAGHWNGLLHTFEDGCLGGDGVSDTPMQGKSSTGCNNSANTCPSSPGNDPVHNFMDYSHDCCMYQFTYGQSELMGFLHKQYRTDTRGSKFLLIHEGIWGEWKQWNGDTRGGYYACGAEMRFEDKTNSDNTAANGLRLKFCSIFDWDAQRMKSIYDGERGSWKGIQMCPIGHFIGGARVRFEDENFIGDDTALNGLKIWCVNPSTNLGFEVEVYGGLWGVWKPWVWVEGNNMFVKMARVRFEDPRGIWIDDTSWNGLELKLESLIFSEFESTANAFKVGVEKPYA